MKPKPQLGQILYSLNINNAARGKPQTLTPVTVTRVGRTLFEVTPNGSAPNYSIVYYLDSWTEKSDRSPDSQLYLSEQELLDEKEGRDIALFIENTFRYGRTSELPVESLRQIRSIIKKGQP